MKLAGKRILVTGADGFIGSHLVEALIEMGCSVRAFVYYNSFNSWGWLDTLTSGQQHRFEVFSGDIRDPNGVREATKGCDVVFHLAALIAIPFSYHSPDSYIDTNIKGTLNVLQAARQHCVERVLVTSTSEVYGTAQYVPIDERHPFQGQSPYSASKIGADRIAGGEVWLEGQRLNLRNPLDGINTGIAYLTEDRKAQGLFLDMSVRENITISVLGRDALAGGLLNRAAMDRLTSGSIQDLRVRVAGPFVTAGSLSGGNQQKLLIARWIAINPKVLILDEPTKGVDIGAKAEIYRIISELAAKGVAIIVISSELPEVIGISDRILVMREGVIVGAVGGTSGTAATQENIMALATGTTEMVQS